MNLKEWILIIILRSKRVSIVHRDMKPENILLSEKLTSKDAETVRVRVPLVAETARFSVYFGRDAMCFRNGALYCTVWILERCVLVCGSDVTRKHPLLREAHVQGRRNGACSFAIAHQAKARIWP